MSDTHEPCIHFALRFHVSFYHSYRGDSLDDRGIGKDIRVIRGILDGLDLLEAEGLPVRAAWDIENYYSLQLYMPRHAPDILERIQARVKAGKDEVEPMSWNNGIITAHDREEFEAAIGMAISNKAGSGLADLFSSWAPIVRPQECMWNAAQIASYRKLGIEAVSVYYSAIPFNGFGSFVAPLPLAQRYNPLCIMDPASGAAMRLLPCYNHGDILEHGASLRGWIRSLRKSQLRSSSPVDLLLLLDMDADDSFWEGYLGSGLPSWTRPLAGLVPPALRGLVPMMRSLRGLPWLRFTLPGEYLKDHGDSGELSLGQDLADGSFDGYSSWSEKEENARLWSIVHEARRKAALAARLGTEREGVDRGALDAALREALEERLRSMSTTHFGMASPVMNAERLVDGFRHAEDALAASERALDLARLGRGASNWYFDQEIDGLGRGSGAIVMDPAKDRGTAFPELMVVEPAASRVRALGAGGMTGGLENGGKRIGNGDLELEAGPGGGIIVRRGKEALFASPLSRPWIRHSGKRLEGHCEALPARGGPQGSVVEMRLDGTITMPRAGLAGEDVQARFSHRYALAAGVQGLRVDIEMEYPRTLRRGFDRGKASRLARDWDARWTEVAPFEIEPGLNATREDPVRVWKHDFSGTVSSYDINYHGFGPNREPDSLDNHITKGWVAVSAGGRGLLVAQSDEAETLFAFCPMRVRLDGGRQRVLLNPFGSYHGRQWRYPTATTGLGRLAALAAADNLDPYAPSWEGGRLHCVLFLIPYEGDRPPEGVQRDALVFASKAIEA
ncbi:MAG: hypothetical protein ACOYM2_02890 [Rectinemataceae bacterium]